MKARIEQDCLVFGGPLRSRRLELIRIEGLELIPNHASASLRLTLDTGETVTVEKLDAALAGRLRDEILPVVRPPALSADEPLGLDEVGRRLDEAGGSPRVRASRLAGFIFDQAVRHGASDVHLDAAGSGLTLSLRIDGVLHAAGGLGPEAAARLVTHLKVEAGVASYRSDVPQEGATRIGAGDGRRDVRLSFVPSREGEAVVARIFGQNLSAGGFAELGFSAAVADGLTRLTSRREGMVLLTGPSASGKTTTLYTALRGLAGKGSRVVSLEDPVECELAGVTQVETDPRREMTFARLLGNLLRQDAEVIMVGEIRDRETAAVAVQAALTGHLILSTIHAGRAPEVVTRLLDLGLEPYQVASALAGALSQRLLRRVCTACGRPTEPDRELLEAYAGRLPDGARFMAGPGCDRCYGTGYRGRVAVAELLEAGPGFQELVRARPSRQEAIGYARDNGMTPIDDDALGKAAQGITTLAEVKRVLG